MAIWIASLVVNSHLEVSILDILSKEYFKPRVFGLGVIKAYNWKFTEKVQGRPVFTMLKLLQGLQYINVTIMFKNTAKKKQ